MGQAQINVRTRACSGTFIARTKQAALTHNVRGKELRQTFENFIFATVEIIMCMRFVCVRECLYASSIDCKNTDSLQLK